MESDSKFIFELLVSWGPILLLIGVWIYFIKRSGQINYKEYVKQSLENSNSLIEQIKLLNKKLDVIIDQMKSNRG